MTPYRVIRSHRRTAALEVTRAGEVVVRAPMRFPETEIRTFVESHETWIKNARSRQADRAARHPEPDAAETDRLRRKAAEILPGRVEYFSKLTGLVPTGVKITAAKTRFGSCSGKNSICFSYRLMLYPPEAVDYVVLHELAHIKHHNHGKDFWALVARYMPDYKARRQLLRQ